MTVYIYRLSSESELLYVGITKNPTIRFQNHATAKPWWSEVSGIKLQMLPSLDVAIQAEQLAIQTEHPRYNIRNNSQHPHSLDDLIGPDTKRYKVFLPQDEIDHLMSLENDEEVLARSYELFRAGWPMKELILVTRLRPSSAYLRTKFAETIPEVTGRPLPEFPPTPGDETKARGLGFRTSSRSLTPPETARLKALAELAKDHRAQYEPSHPTTIAVAQYVDLIKHLHGSEKITIPDIAKAAGVDQSTIRRRYNS